MHFCTILSVCLLQNCKLFFVRFTSPLTLDCICRGRPLWVSFSLSRYPGASSASSLQCWLLLFKICVYFHSLLDFLIFFFYQYFIPFTLFHEYSRNLYFFYWSNWPAAVVLPELRKSLQKLCVSVATPFFYVSGGSLRLFTKSPNLATAVPLFFRDASSIVYLPGDFSTTLYQLLPSLNFSSLASLFPS